jgi:putative endopeptidase
LFLYPTQYFFNALATRNLTVYNMIHKMFKPVNKEAWEMTPPTVNAYYDPTKNQMVLPAGILQSPYFFDETYPMAMNMGGAGNVVGHELSHGMRCEREHCFVSHRNIADIEPRLHYEGFDDEGSQYDGTGKLHEWWPTSVRHAFEQRAACVSNLYSQFEVLPGVYINGNLTLGENLADISGIISSSKAYQQVYRIVHTLTHSLTHSHTHTHSLSLSLSMCV